MDIAEELGLIKVTAAKACDVNMRPRCLNRLDLLY